MTPKKSFIKLARWTVLSSSTGLASGLSAALFLTLLSEVTELRESSLTIIYFLPIAGLFIGFIYNKYGKSSQRGNNLILDEIHEPINKIPFRMIPFVMFGTLLTHLFGGSAGREGTAVQMGGALSDQISRLFRVTPYERKVLLIAGSGAGFGAAISAPLAGIIFGMEIITVGKIKLFAIFQCTVASLVGFGVVQILQTPHTLYPPIDIPNIQLIYTPYLLLAGIIFGVTANFFSTITHRATDLFNKYIPYPPFRPLIGGTLLLIFFYIEGSYDFLGLGLNTIKDSLIAPAHWSTPLLKIFFTALTLASGFKGGEFTPLVFIGATLGSSLAGLSPIPFEVLAAVGFISVFAGASNAPISCIIMGAEIFGIEIIPYAFIACYISYYFSGHNGIYHSQKYMMRKERKLLSYFKVGKTK